MPETLLEYQTPVCSEDGRQFRARACGAAAHDGTARWNGWIEFAEVGGGTRFRTERETTQPNREATAYWATGLTPRYLEGALRRALDRVAARRQRRRVGRQDDFSPPAVAAVASDRAAAPPVIRFSDVGGMESLKAQVRRIVEMIHPRRSRAREYGIVRNGILLHGPPGCGKTFFAKAVAGEFGLCFFRVSLASVISKHVGGAPEAIKRVFDQARAATPSLLFFDEFDAVASNRRNLVNLHEQQMVDALLQQLDADRTVPGLLIMAATNRLGDLDRAVIREGRFDYTVEVPRPDLEARQAILRALLHRRPHAASISTTNLAQDLEGFSAAQIHGLVDEAALLALETGALIGDQHLRAAYRARTLATSYSGAKLRWDDLILPDQTKQKLRAIEHFIENPRLARDLGVTPPSGILLVGPPGTGKTTIARVLASETEAAFFAVSAADIFSKWLGESEQRLKELFERARTRVPAIIFIDELDAVAESRRSSEAAGEGVRNAVVNTLLVEMDGLDAAARIFVIGATNRPDLLDQALLRPGRLGETIEIALPDAAGRKALFDVFSRKMRLHPSVNLTQLAEQTEGASGADLQGLCTLAGRNAFLREFEGGSEDPGVTSDDFARAFDELLAGRTGNRPRRRAAGFQPESDEAP